MWILAYFTHDGEPATGLSPLIKVRDVETGTVVINNVSMIEKGDGIYGYDFNAYNPQKDYAIICDSVTLSGVERYTYASSGEYNEVLDDIESTVGIVDIRTTLLRKIQTNRLELFDGDTDNWILYDDDAVTPLLTFSVSDKDGDIIVQCPQSPSKRSGAAGLPSGTLSPDIYMRKSVYDPDDDGCVTCAENVSDGIYSSTASGVKYAVDNSHHPCILGTKCIDESNIGDGLIVAYDAASDRLVYTTITGVTISGVVTDHGALTGLLDDDHPQYHTDVRGDARYYTQTQVLELIGQNKSGIENLSLGDTSTVVTFGAAFSDPNYALIVSLENIIDSPASEYALTITDKTVNGFTVNYSGHIDSDNYTLNWYATLSGGLAGGNYITNLIDDTNPELGGDLVLGDYSIVANTTPSGWSGEISTMIVDWNDNGIGTPLHMKSNGHWEQCDASSNARMPCGALALEAGTGTKKILWKGMVKKTGWSWTPGKIIYVSTVDGALTSTAPTASGTVKQAIGLAIASNTIRFDPGFNAGEINT
jgi:hypothetical protein